MVFSSSTFLLVFLPLLLILYFVCNRLRWRNSILLIASLLFYAWGEPIWICALLAITALNYALAFAIGSARRGKRLLLSLAVAASLAALIWFKYAAFFVNTFTALLGIAYTLPTQHLPIGISFYTFQIITYTVDVYRGDAQVQRNPLRLLLYVCCFPQLIAGPIVRYGDVEQALSSRSVTLDDFTSGMMRFMMGLGKKVLLANLIGQILLETTSAGGGAELSFFGAWFSALLYCMQLYFDFAAYSDMAIGLGRVLGFRYRENFLHPYASSSYTDFWHRWHISLTDFFLHYLYIPLGGNRRGTARTILNMAIVWLLTGLWHGAGMNFVLWGLYNFTVLTLERFVLQRFIEKRPKAVGYVLTTAISAIGFVLFSHTDLAAAVTHILAMFGLAPSTSGGLHFVALVDDALLTVLKKYTLFPFLAAAFCAPLGSYFNTLLRPHPRLQKAAAILQPVALSAVFLLSLMFLIGQSYNPFIYFRF